jgi:magnesium transporter
MSTLVDAALGKIALQQNSDMRKISAWVALAAVPTLVAGIYGMNFDCLPRREHWRWGYPGGHGVGVVHLRTPVPLLPSEAIALAGWAEPDRLG